jgi:sigma-E factor negative regulatory protein RseB
MSVVKYFFMALLLYMGSALAEEPGPNALRVLEKMTQAMKVLNYQGTVAFLKNGKLEPMKYVHAAEKGIEQERLLSLNSPLREIIRDADKISCHFKETRQTIVDHRPFERSFLVDMPANLEAMGTIYQFEMMGEENVAMLPSYIIAIRPKDNYRYSRKLWIDKQSFLPLKVVIYDNSGAPLEQVVFTGMEVKESLPFAKAPDADDSTRHIHEFKPQPSGQAGFVATVLPPGFHELFFTRKPIHDIGQLVDHLSIGDGFTLVSIYMESKSEAMQSGPQAVGAVNFFSRTLDDRQLTVMGEVPAETVKLIAEGIKLRNPAE